MDILKRSNFVEKKEDIKTCIRSNNCNNCRNKLHQMSSSNTRYDLSMLMSTYKFAFIHALTNHMGLSAMVCFEPSLKPKM